jgi:hypothetical protein
MDASPILSLCTLNPYKQSAPSRTRVEKKKKKKKKKGARLTGTGSSSEDSAGSLAPILVSYTPRNQPWHYQTAGCATFAPVRSRPIQT